MCCLEEKHHIRYLIVFLVISVLGEAQLVPMLILDVQCLRNLILCGTWQVVRETIM